MQLTTKNRGQWLTSSFSILPAVNVLYFKHYNLLIMNTTSFIFCAFSFFWFYEFSFVAYSVLTSKIMNLTESCNEPSEYELSHRNVSTFLYILLVGMDSTLGVRPVMGSLSLPGWQVNEQWQQVTISRINPRFIVTLSHLYYPCFEPRLPRYATSH